MLNYEYLYQLVDDDETQEEILQRLWNLQTLLSVKKRFGDLVDVTDRLFGYMMYSEYGNSQFVNSTLAVIFSLPENLEMQIDATTWIKEEWEAEGYPKVNYEEIFAMRIPFEWEPEEMRNALTVLPCSQSLELYDLAQLTTEADALVIKEKYHIQNAIKTMETARIIIIEENDVYYLLIYSDMNMACEAEIEAITIEVCTELRRIFEGGEADA